MGVAGLWKALHPTSQVTLASLPQVLARDEVRLGIDVSAWMYHATKSQGGLNAELRLLLYRLLKLLAVPHLHPVFIFDGPGRPKIKRGLARAASTWKQVERLRELILALGFALDTAPGEAEAELAHRCMRGEIDAVLTDDADALVLAPPYSCETAVSNAQIRDKAPAQNSEESDYNATEAVRKNAQAAVRKAGPDGSLALFCAADIARLPSGSDGDVARGVDIDGLVLIAILAGGDYDLEGLMNCGVKIAMGLAAAGYGKSLVQGFKRHCVRPKPEFYAAAAGLPAPIIGGGWAAFRSAWLEGIRTELRTNASKLLPRRCDKLSRSRALDALLATPQALAVLSSYIWPLVTQAASSATITQHSFDLKALLRCVRVELGWGKESCLRRCRTLVWEGIIIRQIQGGAGWSDERPLHDTPTATRISNCFSGASLGSAGASGAPSSGSRSVPSKEAAKGELGRAIVVAIHGVRDGVNGREARVEWNVRPLFLSASRVVEETEEAYQAAKLERERLQTFEEDADPKTPSRKAVDHEAPIRTWTSVALLSKSAVASAAIEQWQVEQVRRDAARAKAEQRRTARSGLQPLSKGQRALTNFFTVAKTSDRLAAKEPSFREAGPSTSARRVKSSGARNDVQTASRSSSSRGSSKQNEIHKEKPKHTSDQKTAAPRPSTPPRMTSALRKGKQRAASSDWSDPDASLPSPSTLLAGKSPRKSPRKTSEQRTVRGGAVLSTPSERALAEIESDGGEDDSIVLVRGPAPPRVKTKPQGSIIVISDSD